MKIYNKTIFEILRDNRLAPPTSILQVGASVGQELEIFSKNGIDYGLFIEPLDDQFRVLSDRMNYYQNFVAVQALCTAYDGQTAKFYISSNGGESSSMLRPHKHLTLYPSVNFADPLAITGWSLDSLVRICTEQNKGCCSFYELIYMDVQGAELEVVKGASRQLAEGKYVYTEIGLGGGYQGDVDMETLLGALRNYGYRVLALEMNVPANYGNCLLGKF